MLFSRKVSIQNAIEHTINISSSLYPSFLHLQFLSSRPYDHLHLRNMLSQFSISQFFESIHLKLPKNIAIQSEQSKVTNWNYFFPFRSQILLPLSRRAVGQGNRKSKYHEYKLNKIEKKKNRKKITSLHDVKLACVKCRSTFPVHGVPIMGFVHEIHEILFFSLK